MRGERPASCMRHSLKDCQKYDASLTVPKEMSHHVSIGTGQSVSSNCPESPLCGSKIPSSSRTVSSPITDTGSNIGATSDVDLSLIKEPIVRKELASPPLAAFSGEVPSKHNYRASPRPGGVSHEVRYIYPEGMQNSHWHSYPKIPDDEESITPSPPPRRRPSSRSRVDGSIRSPLRHPIPDDGQEGTRCASKSFSVSCGPFHAFVVVPHWSCTRLLRPRIQETVWSRLLSTLALRRPFLEMEISE